MAYSYTTLDDPSAITSGGTHAYGINDAGQIVGQYYDAGIVHHSFLYSGGTYTALDDPLTTSRQPGTGTYAYGINDAGQIVGYYANDRYVNNFLYSGGTYTSLGDPLATISETSVHAINDAGQIVGYYSGATGVHGLLATITTTVVERFFDTATGDHFYTLSPAEANQIRATLPTYHDEGTPWSTPDKGSNTIDVFRFFDVATGTHFLTSSTAERDQVIATLPSYHYEGVAFEAYQTPASGTLTLERFFNTNSYLHTYSASAAETTSIVHGGAGPGWVDEGAGFIVHA